jgi:hypothetical protein
MKHIKATFIIIIFGAGILVFLFFYYAEKFRKWLNEK